MAAPAALGQSELFRGISVRPCSLQNQEAPAAAAESAGGAGLLQALLGAPVIAGLVGLFLAWWFYIRSPETPKKLAVSLAAALQIAERKIFYRRIVCRRDCPAAGLDLGQDFVARCG